MKSQAAGDLTSSKLVELSQGEDDKEVQHEVSIGQREPAEFSAKAAGDVSAEALPTHITSKPVSDQQAQALKTAKNFEASGLQTKQAGEITANLVQSIELVDGQASSATLHPLAPRDLAVKGTKASGEESASVLAEVQHLSKAGSTDHSQVCELSDHSTRQFSIERQHTEGHLTKPQAAQTANEHVVRDSITQKSSFTQREFGDQQVETGVNFQKIAQPHKGDAGAEQSLSQYSINQADHLKTTAASDLSTGELVEISQKEAKEGVEFKLSVAQNQPKQQPFSFIAAGNVSFDALPSVLTPKMLSDEKVQAVEAAKNFKASGLQTKQAGEAIANLSQSIELVDGQADSAILRPEKPKEMALKDTKASEEALTSVLSEVSHLPEGFGTAQKSVAVVSDQSARQFSIQQQHMVEGLTKLGDVGLAGQFIIKDHLLEKSSSTHHEFGDQQVKTAVNLKKLVQPNKGQAGAERSLLDTGKNIAGKLQTISASDLSTGIPVEMSQKETKEGAEYKVSIAQDQPKQQPFTLTAAGDVSAEALPTHITSKPVSDQQAQALKTAKNFEASGLQTKQAGEITANLVQSIELVDGQASSATLHPLAPRDLAVKGTKASGEESASVLAEVQHLSKAGSTDHSQVCELSDHSTRQFSIERQHTEGHLTKSQAAQTANEHVVRDSITQKSSFTQREFGDQQVELLSQIQAEESIEHKISIAQDQPYQKPITLAAATDISKQVDTTQIIRAPSESHIEALLTTPNQTKTMAKLREQSSQEANLSVLLDVVEGHSQASAVFPQSKDSLPWSAPKQLQKLGLTLWCNRPNQGCGR
uniref:Uncharacterized protein n=1 Tax=Ditylenchus dipsaci TaxID=166011 RepID=A0A915CZM9_9BILA